MRDCCPGSDATTPAGRRDAVSTAAADLRCQATWKDAHNLSRSDASQHVHYDCYSSSSSSSSSSGGETPRHRPVCVEPRTSALNMTLPVAAARAPATIDRYLLSALELQQTIVYVCSTSLQLPIDGTGRRTDRRTPDRCIDANCILCKKRQ